MNEQSDDLLQLYFQLLNNKELNEINKCCKKWNKLLPSLPQLSKYSTFTIEDYYGSISSSNKKKKKTNGEEEEQKNKYLFHSNLVLNLRSVSISYYLINYIISKINIFTNNTNTLSTLYLNFEHYNTIFLKHLFSKLSFVSLKHLKIHFNKKHGNNYYPNFNLEKVLLSSSSSSSQINFPQLQSFSFESKLHSPVVQIYNLTCLEKYKNILLELRLENVRLTSPKELFVLSKLTNLQKLVLKDIKVYNSIFYIFPLYNLPSLKEVELVGTGLSLLSSFDNKWEYEDEKENTTYLEKLILSNISYSHISSFSKKLKYPSFRTLIYLELKELWEKEKEEEKEKEYKGLLLSSTFNFQFLSFIPNLKHLLLTNCYFTKEPSFPTLECLEEFICSTTFPNLFKDNQIKYSSFLNTPSAYKSLRKVSFNNIYFTPEDCKGLESLFLNSTSTYLSLFLQDCNFDPKGKNSIFKSYPSGCFLEPYPNKSLEIK